MKYVGLENFFFIQVSDFDNETLQEAINHSLKDVVDVTLLSVKFGVVYLVRSSKNSDHPHTRRLLTTT